MVVKTIRGKIRKDLSGDGRKNPSTGIREALFGKKSRNKKKS